MEYPTVSILMPVHNGMPFLPETINSILAQTHRDFELLAIDDGSTDDTSKYLQSLTDPRIKYFRLEKAGLVAALNHGLQHATTPLVARIDSDDVATPDRIKLQFEYMQMYPNCVLLGCDFDEIDALGNKVGDNNYKMTSDAALRWQLLFSMPFLHPGVMFPTQVAIQVGGYRPTYDVAEDYDMWVRLASAGKLAALPDRLMHKRIHPGAVSIVHRTRGLLQSRAIAAEFARTLSPTLDPDAISELYWFYNSQITRTENPIRLLAAFDQTRALVDEDALTKPDMQAALSAARQRLRWLCISHLQRERSPRRALMWFRAMSGFDPQSASLRNIIKRRIPKWCGGTQMPDRQSSQKLMRC